MRLALLGLLGMTELEQIEQPHHVFVEKYPTTKEYTDRLAEEVELISKHRFTQNTL